MVDSISGSSSNWWTQQAQASSATAATQTASFNSASATDATSAANSSSAATPAPDLTGSYAQLDSDMQAFLVQLQSAMGGASPTAGAPSTTGMLGAPTTDPSGADTSGTDAATGQPAEQVHHHHHGGGHHHGGVEASGAGTADASSATGDQGLQSDVDALVSELFNLAGATAGSTGTAAATAGTSTAQPAAATATATATTAAAGSTGPATPGTTAPSDSPQSLGDVLAQDFMRAVQSYASINPMAGAALAVVA